MEYAHYSMLYYNSTIKYIILTYEKGYTIVYFDMMYADKLCDNI